MCTRTISLLILIFLSLNIQAQTQDCNCLENLNATITKTGENYAGYPAKINAATSKNYKAHVAVLQQKASKETNPKRCYYILRDYVRFFKDKHFIISYTDQKDFDSTVIDYSEEYFRNGFDKKTLTPVEGIWTNPDSTIKVAIQKMKDGTFKAVRITSTKDRFPGGFVYFTLTPKGKQYVVKEYNSFLSTDIPAKQDGNLLRLWNHALWGRTFPQTMTEAESNELSTWKNNNNGLAFTKISQDVAHLKVPTFYNNDNKIEKLIASSDSIIRSTRYLLVDLRGNGGGNTGWAYFIQYFMTNNITQPSAFLRVTPDNVKSQLPQMEAYVKQPISEEYKKYFPPAVLDAYKKAYEELPTTTKKFYPVQAVTFPLDSITMNPRKIGLIVDNFCGSSTEYFFSLSKQSGKTITYGEHTIGMMDYQGMSNPTPLPYGKFILTIPIVKSSWTDTRPIDQTGFTPDVRLTLPQDKWLEFVINDLRKR